MGQVSTQCEIRAVDQFLRLIGPLMDGKIISGIGKGDYLETEFPPFVPAHFRDMKGAPPVNSGSTESI